MVRRQAISFQTILDFNSLSNICNWNVKVQVNWQIVKSQNQKPKDEGRT